MKRIIFICLVVFLLFVIGNLVVSLATLWSKKDVLIQTQSQLVREQKEHQKLLSQLQEAQTPLFIEEEARNKLFLGKPGDSIVFLPQATPSGSVAPSVEQKPVWQQWLELFFK